jgi:hypothetical protein
MGGVGGVGEHARRVAWAERVQKAP